MLVDIGPTVEFLPSYELEEGEEEEEMEEVGLDELEVNVNTEDVDIPKVGESPGKNDSFEKTTMRLKP